MPTLKQQLAALSFYAIRTCAILIMYLLIYSIILKYLRSTNLTTQIQINAWSVPLSLIFAYLLVVNQYTKRVIWNKLVIKLEKIFT